MKLLILFIAWCILFLLSWPLALLALVLMPVLWLISLPIRLIITIIEAVLALIRTLFFLPARLLGFKKE
jgi:hypothetical protein